MGNVLKLLLVLAALGDVEVGTCHAQHLAVAVLDHPATALDPALAAVSGLHAEGGGVG